MSDSKFQSNAATSHNDLLAGCDRRGLILWPVVVHPADQPASERTLKHLRASKINRFANPNSCAPVGLPAESILQLVPVADAAIASELALRNVASTVVATVDHFVQAEILQRAASTLNTNISVLVAVNSGAHYFGCRPGTEALQLALAVDCLPNLSFHGLSSELPVPCSTTRPASANSAISAMQGTATKLKQDGLPSAMLHLRSHSVIKSESIPEGWHLSMPASAMFGVVEDTVPEVLASSLTATVISRPSLTATVISRPPLTATVISRPPLTATVISRPSLEFAVLDCGRRMLSGASAVVLANGIRLPVKQRDDNRCVVCVCDSAIQPAAVELVIGQRLQVIPSGIGCEKGQISEGGNSQKFNPCS